METPNPYILTTLKKRLSLAIVQNHYNLLSPEVLILSQEIDLLMNPLFENQLKKYIFLNTVS